MINFDFVLKENIDRSFICMTMASQVCLFIVFGVFGLVFTAFFIAFQYSWEENSNIFKTIFMSYQLCLFIVFGMVFLSFYHIFANNMSRMYFKRN